MKSAIKTSIKELFGDRSMLIVAGVLVVLLVVFLILFGVQIHTDSIKVKTHYTSFGTVNFYPSPWQYLYVFLAFGAVLVLSHIAISLKLYRLKGRNYALMFAWFTVGILLFSTIVIQKIINIASLS